RVGHSCWQEEVVSGVEGHRACADSQARFALEESDPLVLLLNVLFGLVHREADDALDHEVPVAEKNLEPLTRGWGRGISKEVSDAHGGVRANGLHFRVPGTFGYFGIEREA